MREQFQDDGINFDLSRTSDLGGDIEASTTTRQTTDDDIPRHSEKIQIANQESRRVDWMRYVLFLVLLMTAFSISAVAYSASKAQEEESFHETFEDMAQKLVDTFVVNARRRLVAVESMSVAITSSAIAEGQTWPNVTVADYERKAGYTMDLSDLMCLFFVPFVTGENRKGYEAYSTAHQGYIDEGLTLQGDIAKGQEDEQESIDILEATWGPNSPNNTIPEQIIRLTGTGVEVATGLGPFAPTWMMAPAIPVRNVINYDALSHPTRRLAVSAMMKNPTNVLTEAWDYSDTSNPTTVGKKAALNLFLNRRKGARQSYQDGPVSDLYVPIYDTHEPTHWTNRIYFRRKVVGYLTGYVYWQAFLVNILPPNSNEVVVILSNSCGQAFTYGVHGQEATYVGPGDLHDPKYDHLEEITTGHGAFLGHDMVEQQDIEHLPKGQCVYKVRVYPSQELEDSFTTNGPWIVTAVIISTFLITSGAFVLYDVLVQRRQKIVLKHAVKSTEVLHSLFPAPVRERLGSAHLGTSATSQSTKFAIDKKSEDQDGIIADLYPEATVLFADLAGFTSWSSTREPKDVFLLLESLYGAFDKIAARRVVFKIETIGDCYLAVTGVPRPQEKHALIMARFATECMAKMDSLVKTRLVGLLGPETANLKLRVGIHSGAVTAGVLRGARARFQLFGDTVNTASRMESNSIAGRIQCSESTAKLFMEAGKGEWLSEREGGVEAKGKGRLRTWWVKATFLRRSASSHDGSEKTPFDVGTVRS